MVLTCCATAAALLVERMMAGGWLTHLATNGAGTIHDWEYAWLGASTESVETTSPPARSEPGTRPRQISIWRLWPVRSTGLATAARWAGSSSTTASRSPQPTSSPPQSPPTPGIP